MDLQNFSDDILVKSLERHVLKEREVILEVLLHLIEIEKRRAYLELGYSSLFTFLTQKLRYSEGAAQRRILAARTLNDNPELGALLLRGEVTLCIIATAAKSIKSAVTCISEIAGKSKREVEQIVAKAQPVKKVLREKIKPVFLAPPPVTTAQLQPEERYELKFSVSKEVYEQFEEARNRLAHANSAMSIEGVFGKLLQKFLKRANRKPNLTNTSRRNAPNSIKELVRENHQGQCSYIAKDGTRCCEKAFLQIDHILPFAVGGKTEPENLRLLCSAHNQHCAEKHFGKAFMQQVRML